MSESNRVQSFVVGMDVGDRKSELCVVDGEGKIVETGTIMTEAEGMEARFGTMAPTRIVLEGDRYLRSTLVQCAHYILSRGPDSELKRWGEAHVGTNANQRKRTIVAMARKLAVLMHHLWATGEVYDPFYHTHREERKAALEAWKATQESVKEPAMST